MSREYVFMQIKLHAMIKKNIYFYLKFITQKKIENQVTICKRMFLIIEKNNQNILNSIGKLFYSVLITLISHYSCKVAILFCNNPFLQAGTYAEFNYCAINLNPCGNNNPKRQ